MIGTIEHLRKPVETINLINKLLKKDGYLVVTTADIKGIIPIYMLKPPEHLYYFCRKSINYILEKNGLKLVKYQLLWWEHNILDVLCRMLVVFRLNFMQEFLFKTVKKQNNSINNKSMLIPTNEMLIYAKK